MKSFRNQCIECKQTGNMIEVDISVLKLTSLPGILSGIKKSMDVKTILVCLKYRSVCSSKVCKEERGMKL